MRNEDVTRPPAAKQAQPRLHAQRGSLPGSIDVGSEPAGLALSPDGKTLVGAVGKAPRKMALRF